MVEKPLSQLNSGEKGRVVKVVGDPLLRRRLVAMGVVRGAEVIVVRRAPLGDPMELLLKGYYLSLRRNEAENVFVEVDGKQT
ncbi:MAG: FeoA family protein [Thermoprotei archaeon]|nr:FeoA family protein [Thermoprotei archaeon]